MDGLLSSCDIDVSTSPKRRKIRKGTQSCWQCKRRKIRCTFASLARECCDGCKSRGVACIGQDIPEDDAVSTANGPAVENTTQRSRTTARPVPMTSSKQSNPRSNSEHQVLRRALLSAWPEQQMLDQICHMKVGSAVLFHGTICLPYTTLFSKEVELMHNVLQLPTPESHPIFLARKLLLLATLLQGAPPSAIEELGELSTITCHELMARAIDVTRRHVTSNDELVSSIEGIECLMIESMYHNGTGNLKQAWLTNRRAMALAQVLGLQRQPLSAKFLEESTKERIDPYSMWFRIITTDRYLSLMLALPQGINDSPFATHESLQDCDPLERMERIESLVGSLIIERNKDSLHDIEETLRIDRLLQDAGESMPPRWWLPPDIKMIAGSGVTALKETLRIMNQFTHFYLLAQLHLPFILITSASSNYEYSKITALTASREILSRFLSLRSSNMISVYCKGIDFLAFTASTILCVAHIEAHRQHRAWINNSSCFPPYLKHQRLSDRGLVEATGQIFNEMAETGHDAVASSIYSRVQRLLSIEQAAAQGETVQATFSATHEEETIHNDNGQMCEKHLHINIPHSGTIKINHNTQVPTMDNRHHSRTALSSNQFCNATGTGADLLPSLQKPDVAINNATLPGGAMNYFDISNILDFEQVTSAEECDLHGVDMALFDGLYSAWKC